MKTYIVQRSTRGTHASVLPIEGRIYRLPHLRRHTNLSYDYGSTSAEASDMARSIVGDLLGTVDPKPALYRPVMEQIVSQVSGAGPIYITEAEVRKAMSRPR